MSSYPTQQLANTGVRVSASDLRVVSCLIEVGFGGMGLSFAYGPRKSEEENFKVLSRAADIGVTFWDTADVYGFGHNEGTAFRLCLIEELIGKWFKSTGRRDEIFLATKFGNSLDGKHTINTTPEYVKQACDASLKRLQIPQIDLYYMHRFVSRACYI